jgi:hypothetical protein
MNIAFKTKYLRLYLNLTEVMLSKNCKQHCIMGNFIIQCWGITLGKEVRNMKVSKKENKVIFTDFDK